MTCVAFLALDRSVYEAATSLSVLRAEAAFYCRFFQTGIDMTQGSATSKRTGHVAGNTRGSSQQGSTCGRPLLAIGGRRKPRSLNPLKFDASLDLPVKRIVLFRGNFL